MDKNRKIFITLIIVVLVLIIIATGVIIYFTIFKDKFPKHNSNDNNISQNHNIDFQIADIDDEETRIQNNLLEESEKMARQTFNTMFETYKGTEINSTQIKQLFSQIESNNSTREDGHIIELDSQGITDKNQISLDNTYEVQMFYNEEGYINKILITEKKTAEEIVPEENSSENMDKLVFNAQFTPFEGTITGSQFLKVIDIVNENNNNTSHIIEFRSNNITSLNLDEVTDEQKFQVTLRYDDNGYVNILVFDLK